MTIKNEFNIYMSALNQQQVADLIKVYQHNTVADMTVNNKEISFRKNVKNEGIDPRDYTFYRINTQNGSISDVTANMRPVCTGECLIIDVIGTRCITPAIAPLDTSSTIKDLKVLTYNISWESMTGKRGWPLGPKELCQQNVANVINNNGPYDFVGLQEASNWDKVRDFSPVLLNMKRAAIKIQPNKEKVEYVELVSFWNPQYKENSDKRIYGDFRSLARKAIKDRAGFNFPGVDRYGGGRPYLILFFDDIKTVFINAHFPHQDQQELLNLLIHTYLHQYKNYLIIIAADCNTNFNKNIMIDGIKFTVGNTSKNSCCLENGYTKAYDHVIANNNNDIDTVIPPIISPASDHYPIIATIKR